MAHLGDINNYQRIVEKKFKIIPNSNPIIVEMFSTKNIKFIQDYVQNYVLNHTGIKIRTEQDTDALVVKMIEVLELYMSNGCARDDPVSAVNRMNKNVMTYYIKETISGINAYKAYYDRISKPVINDIRLPVNSSVKGANVLSINMGFQSSHERNNDIRDFNLNKR